MFLSAHLPPLIRLRAAVSRQARAARDRQLRGETGDLPVLHRPVSVAELEDVTGLLRDRWDLLAPARLRPATLLGRALFRVKQMIRRVVRRPLLRQVGFNAAVLDYAQRVTTQLDHADRTVGELCAVVRLQRRQILSLTERIQALEAREGPDCQAGSLTHAPRGSGLLPDGPGCQAGSLTHEKAFQEYAAWFSGGGLVVALDCGDGALVRGLLAEGLSVQGVEARADLAEGAREHELPVVTAAAPAFLRGCADDSLGGIHLDASLRRHDLADLLPLCWRKLRKGGVLVAESSCGGPHLERLRYQVEEGCFRILGFPTPRTVVGQK